MRKILLPLLMLGLFTQITFAQDVIILDHEAPLTTTNYQFFGGSIEGLVNNVIANPNPTGINTSAMVGDFQKVTDSPTWGGGFPNPALQVPLDFSTGSTEVCVKVHMDHIGNLAFKLENSTNGGPTWIRSVANTVVNEWEELCFDVTLPGLEDTMEPAVGFSYPQGVLFFDFGTVPTVDQVYYFDDIIVKEGAPLSPGDVTLSVDMSNYTGTFTQVYASGTFNGWSGTDNPMMDNGNGIWTVTIPNIPAGAHEFKFTADDWAVQEEFGGGSYDCTVTDPSGQFTNRSFSVNGDLTMPAVCFNSCFACGDGVKITVNLGAAHIMTSADGMFIAGGGNFGNPGENPLADPDGDDVWTWVFEKQTGFSSYYTYLNGNCPDWSCKEQIAGLPCSSPFNFDDRFMGPLMADTVITTCYGECSDVVTCAAQPLRSVTFSVDMNSWPDAFTQPYLSGSFNGWSGDANPMDDSDGDGVWTTTLDLTDGDYQYKFQLDQWTTDEVLVDGDPCTITDGTFVNRLISVTEDVSVCYEFRTCNECAAPDPGNITLEVNMNVYSGTFTTVFLSGAFNGWDGAANPMEDPDGDGIWSITVMMPGGPNEYKFQVDEWTAQEEFAGGESCTVTDPSGQFVNRLITVNGDASECWNWNVCAECNVSADDLTFDKNLFQVNPTLTSDFTQLTFNENVNGTKTVLVHNLVGKVIYRAELDATDLQHDIYVTDWTNGLYLITVQTDNLIASKKITKF